MRLREARTSDVVKHAVMFLVCVALVIAAPWIPDNDPGKPTPDRLLQVMYGFFGLCMLFGFFLALGRWRREIVIDEDGLKLLDRGNLEWSLRWEEFGGWARSSGAIVVLDRSGAAVGSSEIGKPDGFTSGGSVDRIRFIAELEKHLPEGGFRPVPPAPTPPKVLTTTSRCLIVLLAGVAVTATGVYGLDQMFRGAREGDAAHGIALWLFKHRATWPLMLIPLILGPLLMVQGAYAWHLLIKARWKRDEDPDDTSAPPPA
ncbi:MAG TPA: hypothetical protein PLH94_12545 [Fimbriimonadaceae bacterium]|nr:hypothetical protein [Fimbriimonadaceae bacterium]